jgi:hypothetical protein
MRKARNNNNFIDKTFTIIADVILRVFPASQQEKKAFSYYLNGLSAQDEGEYAEALNNYYQALQIEDRSGTTASPGDQCFLQLTSHVRNLHR